LGVVAGLIIFAWYPHPFLQFNESKKFSLLLIGFAGIIGPFLTWVVYKDHKPKFIFDVVVIVLIQIAAIGWATSKLYHDRPYFMVFTLDRFELLTHNEVDAGQVPDPGFLDKPFGGVIALYATMPTDPQVYSNLVRETVMEGKPDLQYRPQYWSHYEEKQYVAVLASRPLEFLRSNRPEATQAINKWVRENGGNISRFKFVPVTGRAGEFSAILEAGNGKLVELMAIDPWVY